MTVLDSIHGPRDLQRLSQHELKSLADEIRAAIVAVVTRTGGHLASSLGAVELSIALHRVFESPQDKIIWDVGHQTYAHKLLTGRRERFHTLRQYKGLSGFTDPAESPHDAFGAGHASTSISAALGVATARDMAGENFNVVAVIGDGSLSGGMAFEALNYAGHVRKRIIVVLNDNAMAISPSIGAVARTLRRLTLHPKYRRAKEGAGRFVRRLPWGRAAWESMTRFKSGIREMLIPIRLWETLGFKYIGPVDGHNIVDLEDALQKARGYENGPVFVHAVTTKGKGYEPAEDDCVKFHGISAGGVDKGLPSYSEVFGKSLLRLFRENDNLVAVSAAMMQGTCLNLVAKEFPDRVFDVGICEQHAVTFAAGMAKQGFIPVVAIYSTFLQRAFDQVLHDVCIQELPVIFAVDRAGIVGEDGKTHQGAFDLSFLGCIPNLIVAAPCDMTELEHMLHTAVRIRRPIAIRYPRSAAISMSENGALEEIPVGKARLLASGDDVAIIAIGSTVAPALRASELLSEKGIKAAVLNARCAKPLDESCIRELASQTGRLVTVEENSLLGGFGSSVLNVVAGMPDVRVLCIGLPDEFIEHGSQALLRARYGIDAEGIAERLLSFFPDLRSLSASRRGGE